MTVQAVVLFHVGLSVLVGSRREVVAFFAVQSRRSGMNVIEFACRIAVTEVQLPMTPSLVVK